MTSVTFEALRTPLAQALRTQLRSESQPVLAAVIAETFAYRLAPEPLTDEDFRAWLVSVCESYADLPYVRELLATLPERTERILHAVAPQHSSAFPTVDLRGEIERLLAIVGAPSASAEAAAPIVGIDARIESLITNLHAKDPLTSEHSRAVSAWCRRLSRHLGLAADDVIYAARAGLLHDIGKVRTPDEILNAPRRLTADERVIMNAHANAGAVMIARDEDLRSFVAPVRSHHERLDGAGYPDGLRTSSIPFMARLVAVADCFNAMIGRRPYRPPMTPANALDELSRAAGTQLDPEIVDAMSALVVEGTHVTPQVWEM